MRTVLRLPLVVLVVALVVALPASAAAAITGQAYLDYNSNGTKDTGGFVSGSSVKATDIPLAGVVVTAYNASGAAAGSATTDATGAYSLSPSGSGPFRIQFATPSGYQPSFYGTQDGTSVQFAADGAANIDFAVVSIGEYCQDNPLLVTCMAPAANVMTASPDHRGAITFPAAFNAAQSFDQRGIEDGLQAQTTLLETGITTVSGVAKLGSVFGVGVDRSGFAYFGTYVKRHSPYGPAGAVNAIYRVNIATGATSTFVTLGSETLPAHSAVAPTGFPDYSQDGRRNITNPSNSAYSDVYSKVGRAGVGDVDVTPDGSTLLAVEMTQAAPKLWFVPIADPATRTALAIPTTLASFGSVDCVGTFHPMGIGVRGDRILVGGVCGGNETRWVDPISGRTEAAAFVLEANPSRSGFSTVAATGLGYDKGGAFLGESLFAWNYATSGGAVTGLWHNWSDTSPTWTPTRNGYPAWGIPMLANIEVMDDGDLVLSFRDRFVDQNKANAVDYEWNGVFPDPTDITTALSPQFIGAGDLLRMCSTPGGYVRETNGTCNGVTGAGLTAGEPTVLSASGNPADSPGYYAAGWYQSDYDGMATPVNCTTGAKCQRHPYTALGGLASLPGSPVLWSTNYDVSKYWQQGVRAFGPCAARAASVGDCGPAGAADGAMIGGAVVEDDQDPVIAPGPCCNIDFTKFAKGNGLGDLELACDAAPVQIGNRVWIDTNKDGIQDPDEAAVAGVTVRLYDANGTLVGTAVTDANGTYYFSSNVAKAAAGDGTNVGGGLTAGAAFTVKLDNPADYAAGGPLQPYVLTKADTTSPENAANSKATMVGGYPTIAIPARTAGQNNHTFDVGFHRSGSDELVAVGDYTWVDTNRNGLQDERPLKGVQVVLLTVKGERAKDAAGKVVPVKTTNRKGYYVFDGLNAGSYRVRFVLPVGYRFTKQGAANAKRNSNPRATKANPLVGLTPVFEVYAAVKGNTVRNTNVKVNAVYIDPTIDAGVVRYAFVPVPSNVTG